MTLAKKKYDAIEAKTTTYSLADVDLVKRTVAQDLNSNEFDMFTAVAQRVNLDPLRRQIYAQVYYKNNANKRRIVILTGIDGFRTIADRSGIYRPDENESEYAYDKELVSSKNPLGLVKAVVTVWKQDNTGAWNPIRAAAYWDEFAVLEKNYETGEEYLRDTWARMPRLMLAKCAEAQALRKGWPDDLGSIYVSEEMEQLSASEAVQEYQAQLRREKVKSKGTIPLQMEAGQPFQLIESNKFYDTFCKKLSEFQNTAQLNAFQSVNANALRMFWAEDKDAALSIKEQIDKTAARLEKEENDIQDSTSDTGEPT